MGKRFHLIDIQRANYILGGHGNVACGRTISRWYRVTPLTFRRHLQSDEWRPKMCRKCRVQLRSVNQ